MGVPGEELADAYAWDGWTAGMVRKGAARIALYVQVTPEKLLARAQGQRQDEQAACRDTIRALETKVRDLRRRVRVHEERLRQRRTIPAKDLLEKITRYEAHLTRQMLQTLHTLERLQAARAGEPVPPPAVLDVTLDVNSAAALRAEDGG